MPWESGTECDEVPAPLLPQAAVGIVRLKALGKRNIPREPPRVYSIAQHVSWTGCGCRVAKLKGKPAELPPGYLKQFPLELRRALPKTLPREVVDEPVRIDVVDGNLVLFTRRPPAMNLDLHPLARDRFLVEGIDEVGVIERDATGRATRFLFENDLLQAGKELRGKGRHSEAEQAFSTVVKYFPESAPGQLWLGECLRAKGDAVGAREALRKAQELSREKTSPPEIKHKRLPE